MEPIALKKLTAATILAPEKLVAPKEARKLFVVYGAVTGAQLKPTKFNDQQMLLTGRFEAVRASDRQVLTGQMLYLPDNTYQNQLAQMCVNKETGEVREISFGFSVSVQPMANSPVGYAFVVEPMLDEKAQDALADVRNTVAGKLDKFLPRLAAPTAPAGGTASATAKK